MANNNDIIIDIQAENNASQEINAARESIETLGDSSSQADKDLAELESAFSRLGLELKTLEPKLTAFEKRTVDTFKSIANNSQATGDQISAAFEQSLSKIKSPQGLKQLEAELDKLKTTGKLTESQILELEQKINSVGEEGKKAASGTDQLRDSLDEVSEAAEGLGGEAGGLGQLSSILAVMKNPAVAVAGALAGLIGSFASVNIEAQKTNNILNGLTGSQEKTAAAMEYARVVANNLGTDVGETAKTWVSFDNTMRVLGRTTEQSKSFFESLSYAVVKSGGSMDDVNETVEEFREGMTEGTLNGENLEQILRERLPQAFEGMAQAVGVSNEELGKMLEAGMDIQEVLPLLEKGIKTAFGNPQQIESFDAAVGRLKNSLVNMMTSEDTRIVESFGKAIDWSASKVNDFSVFLTKSHAYTTAFISTLASFYDYTTGNIKSLGDLNTRLNEITQNQIADLAAIEKKQADLAAAAQKTGKDQVSSYNAAELAAKSLNKSIDDILKNIQLFSDKSGVVGSVLEEMFKKANPKTPDEGVNVLTDGIKKLQAQGNITSEQLQQGLQKSLQNLSDTDLQKTLEGVQDQLKKIPQTGADASAAFELQMGVMEESAKRLGVQTTESLKQSAEDAKTNYETLKNSGKAAADTLQSAFLAYAEAQLKASKASGELPPKMLEQEAGSLNLSQAYKNLQGDIYSLSKEQDAIGKNLDKTTEKFNEQISAIEHDAAIKKQNINISSQINDVVRETGKAVSENGKELIKNAAIQKLDIAQAKEKLGATEDLIGAQRKALKEAIKTANQDGIVTEAEQRNIDQIKKKIKATDESIEAQKGQIFVQQMAYRETLRDIEVMKGRTLQQDEFRKGLMTEAETLRQWLIDYEPYHKVMKISVEDINSARGSWEKYNQSISRNMVELSKGFKIRQEEIDSLTYQSIMYDRFRGFIADYTNFVQIDNKQTQKGLQQRIELNAQLVEEHKQRMAIAEQQGDFVTAANEEAGMIDRQKEALDAKLEIEDKELQTLKAKRLETLNAAFVDEQYSETEQQQVEALDASIAAQERKVSQTQEEIRTQKDAIDANKKYNTVLDDFSDKADNAARRNEKLTKAFNERLKEMASETQAQGTWVSNILSGWEKRLGEWSESAKKAFQNVRAGTQATAESYNELDQAIKKNEAATKVALAGLDYGFVKWANTVALQALKVERSFISQAQSAEAFTAQLNKAAEGAYGSTVQITQLVRAAETAKNEMTLLDDSRLSALESSIESARQKLAELTQEAIDAKNELASMNAELAREQGDTYTADLLENELDYKEKLVAIEEKLSAAETSHNTELISLYKQQKQVLESIYEQKDKNIKKDYEEQNQTSTDSSSSSSSSSSSKTTSSSGSSSSSSSGTSTGTNALSQINKSTVLQFLGPSGESVKGIFGEADVARVVDLLKKSGLRLA